MILFSRKEREQWGRGRETEVDAKTERWWDRDRIKRAISIRQTFWCSFLPRDLFWLCDAMPHKPLPLHSDWVNTTNKFYTLRLQNCKIQKTELFSYVTPDLDVLIQQRTGWESTCLICPTSLPKDFSHKFPFYSILSPDMPWSNILSVSFITGRVVYGHFC